MKVMGVKEQVCSLELAKRLKHLGAEQRSLWYWCKHEDAVQHHVAHELEWHELFCMESSGKWSAFTVAELGKLLPSGAMFHRNEKGCWALVDTERHPRVERGDTEAEARAKLLAYLFENDLIRLD